LNERSIRDALHDAVFEVLEKMFFIYATEEDAGDSGAQEPALVVELSFDGDPPGVFRLLLPRVAAAGFAADFLGEEADSLTAREIGEVAKELANMICGAMLSRIESRASFRLSTPSLVAGEPAEDAGSPEVPGTVCTVDTGRGLLVARIVTERRECTSTGKSAF
jgi:hypothetical protein